MNHSKKTKRRKPKDQKQAPSYHPTDRLIASLNQTQRLILEVSLMSEAKVKNESLRFLNKIEKVPQRNQKRRKCRSNKFIILSEKMEMKMTGIVNLVVGLKLSLSL